MVVIDAMQCALEYCSEKCETTIFFSRISGDFNASWIFYQVHIASTIMILMLFVRLQLRFYLYYLLELVKI